MLRSSVTMLILSPPPFLSPCHASLLLTPSLMCLCLEAQIAAHRYESMLHLHLAHAGISECLCGHSVYKITYGTSCKRYQKRHGLPNLLAAVHTGWTADGEPGSSLDPAFEEQGLPNALLGTKDRSEI